MRLGPPEGEKTLKLKYAGPIPPASRGVPMASEDEENIRRFKKKICLVGESAVGKTSLINRFVMKSQA